MSQLPSVKLQTKTPTYRKRGGELTLLATTFMYSLYVWCTVGELYCTECTHSCDGLIVTWAYYMTVFIIFIFSIPFNTFYF